MRVFVISLRDSAERRRAVAEQLDGLGVAFSFFEGIDLRRDRNRYFHHCDDARFLLHTGRTPTIGELGCFASHLLLWRTCRLLNEPLVILEDDAAIDDDFPAALRLARRHIDDLGFIRLEAQGSRPRLPAAVVTVATTGDSQRRIAYCARYPHGATAYAISPRAADAFIRRSEVFRAPVDVFIKRYWRHGQPLHAVLPGVVRTGPAGRQSTIESLQARERQRLAPATRWRRWWLKRRDWVQRGLFNLRWLRRHARRPVQGVLRGLATAAATAFRSGN